MKLPFHLSCCLFALAPFAAAADSGETCTFLIAAEEYESAYAICRDTAERGSPIGQYALGLMYFDGIGVEQDRQQAAEWYRRAAEQGDAGAQYALGWMYGRGEGVAQDKKESAKWTRLAAEQNAPDAQYMLGWLYQNGFGVAEDKQEAYIWFALAGLNKHPRAYDAKAALEETLGEDALAAARQEAKRRLEEMSEQ